MCTYYIAAISVSRPVGGTHTRNLVRGTNGFSNLFRFIVIRHKATVHKKYFSKISTYIVVTY